MIGILFHFLSSLLCLSNFLFEFFNFIINFLLLFMDLLGSCLLGLFYLQFCWFFSVCFSNNWFEFIDVSLKQTVSFLLSWVNLSLVNHIVNQTSEVAKGSEFWMDWVYKWMIEWSWSDHPRVTVLDCSKSICVVNVPDTVEIIHWSEVSHDVEVLDNVLQDWIQPLKHSNLSLQLIDDWHLIGNLMDPIGDLLSRCVPPRVSSIIKFTSQFCLLSLLHDVVLQKLKSAP